MSHAAQLEILADAYEVLGMPNIVAAVKAGAAKLREAGDTGPKVKLTRQMRRLASGAIVGWSENGRRVFSVMRTGDAFRLRIEDAQTTAIDHESVHVDEETAVGMIAEILGTLA